MSARTRRSGAPVGPAPTSHHADEALEHQGSPSRWNVPAIAAELSEQATWARATRRRTVEVHPTTRLVVDAVLAGFEVEGGTR